MTNAMCPDRQRGAGPLRVLVAPDSFKGSLGAVEVAARIAAGVRSAVPDSIVIEAPMADGGEGTALAVATALDGVWDTVAAIDANGVLIDVPFAVCTSAHLGAFAIFDVAEIVGLHAATNPPGLRSTRGVGQAIRAIRSLGHKRIVLGLGGSSTNDGGAGMLAELLFNFVDTAGARVVPVFNNLARIDAVEFRDDRHWLSELELMGLTDVGSPLTGPCGASMVFGAQKGFADLEQADRLLQGLAQRCDALVATPYADVEGAGAAGGLGYGICLLGGKLSSGARFVLDALHLTDGNVNYDWIITGEGRSDRQTLLGKAPALVAQLARSAKIPVTLLSGAVDYDAALEDAFDGCFSVQSGPVTLEYAMNHAAPLLEAASRQLSTLFVRTGLRHWGDGAAQ